MVFINFFPIRNYYVAAVCDITELFPKSETHESSLFENVYVKEKTRSKETVSLLLTRPIKSSFDLVIL